MTNQRCDEERDAVDMHGGAVTVIDQHRELDRKNY